MSDFCRLCSVVFLVERLNSTALESDQNVRSETQIPVDGINEIADMTQVIGQYQSILINYHPSISID